MMMKHDVERIPVRLAGEPGVRYGREPLTFGVPFAEGAFPAGSALRCVTADGRELPLQIAVMATWKKDLKHVKWLLADVQADPARDGETVWLEAATAGPTGNPAPIAVSQADGLLRIDTGALRLTLRTDFPRWKKRAWDSPFVGCEVHAEDGGWRETLNGPGLLLYMKDQHGNLYTSLGSCPAPRVTVEEQGPLRVCVLITGQLTSEQGVLFCPYRLRIHLYAGKADLRIFHTFIFDQDPTRIELQAIGLKVFAGTGDGAVAAVGCTKALSRALSGTLSKHDTDKARDIDEKDALSLLQSDDLHYTALCAGKFAGSGEKAPGWASLGGAGAGVVAALRDFWQEYPKGFRVTADALDVGIWPEDAPQPLSFLTPFAEPPIFFNGTRDEEEIKRLLAERPNAPLALSSFGIRNMDDLRWVEDVAERLAPGRVKSYCDFMGSDTGIGAAKTTEIVLRFAAGPAVDAAVFATAVQEPLAGIVDPGYLCGTNAFGFLLPAGHPQFADLDRHLTDRFERILIEPLVRCRRYGMMLNGHLVNAHGSPTSMLYHLYKDSAPEKALRYVGPFGNEAADLVLGVWGQFLRTGSRRYLRQAQVTSRAVADISFVHAYPGHEERIGCIHYHGPHAWSNGLCWSHSETGFMMADYYLTGNRRSLEVALEVADGVLDKLVPAGIVNSFAALYREFTGPLAILIEVYQATWHEKYGTPAGRSLNWLMRAVRTPGWMPRSIYTRGPRGDEAVVDPDVPPNRIGENSYHAFTPALRLFPSRPLREFVLAQADYASLHGQSVGLCEAYDLTRDPRYAAAALALLQGQKTTIGPDDVLCFYSYAWSEELPRLMKIVALAAEADPNGFLEFARLWREERDAKRTTSPGSPPDQKPETSLGVLSTERFAEQSTQPTIWLTDAT
jgi:hypothetical protein